MNRWGIPKEIEEIVRQRDLRCVYCGLEMLEAVSRGSSRKKLGIWEHIVNDATIVTLENIARCCNSCNASKGSKGLRHWLRSSYCLPKGITTESVAPVVQEHLLKENDSTVSQDSNSVGT